MVKSRFQPVRAKTSGSLASNVIDTCTVAPGATGRSSGSSSTVSSGPEKRALLAVSGPSPTRMLFTSIQPQPSLVARSPRNWPRDSRMKVELSFLKALR